MEKLPHRQAAPLLQIVKKPTIPAFFRQRTDRAELYGGELSLVADKLKGPPRNPRSPELGVGASGGD